jgi:hypothetical protein
MYLLMVSLNVLTPAAEPDARAALALAVAARPESYEPLRARAIAERRPLAVWVGLRRADLERGEWLHYHCASFPGATAPCVVVGLPTDRELWRVADLPANGLSAVRLEAAVAPPASSLFLPPARCGPGGCR